MDNFVQKATKYVSDNPKIIIIVIIALVILVIWLYLKSKNIISGFSSKKVDKLKKSKVVKAKVKDEDDDDDEEDIKHPREIVPKKNVTNPAVAQLVKDINQNS